MSGQGGQGGGGGFGDGQEMNMVYIAVGLVAVALLIGFVFWADIVKVVFYVKLHELRIIAWFMGFFSHSDQSLVGIDGVINWAQEQRDLNSVSQTELIDLAKIVGSYLRWPIIAICGVLGVVLFILHPNKGFTETETMDSLREKMKDVYPAIKVVNDQKLADQSIDEGPWRMAETPIEFAKRNKLLIQESETSYSTNKMGAKAIFTKQLGPKWQGVKKLAPHQKALFAVLCTYIAYERDKADEMFEQMALSASFSAVKAGKIDYSGIDDLIKKYGSTPKVKEIISHHAYLHTIFSELLTQARSTGIVMNSMYLWIKPIDRQLWYTLNNVGRQTVFAETAAVHAHWQAEKQLGYAIPTPMIDSAVDALDEAVRSRLIRNL